jgi:hydroxylamine reductase
MFCYQCEQTVQGKGCQEVGNCGKDATTASLQDLLLQATIDLSTYAHRAGKLGKVDRELDRAAVAALFTTVTNVNFDPARLEGQVRDMAKQTERARSLYEAAAGSGAVASERPSWKPAGDLAGLVRQGEGAGVAVRTKRLGADVTGLQELLTYGVKGTAAYAEHARILGYEDPEAYAFFHEALEYVGRKDPKADELVALCLRCGQVNLKVMALLDKAHTTTYGHPVPTPVRIEPLKGKAILVSGHDLKDLEDLLKQTAGKGINVYTHGEMLPAHGYPALKKYPHLAGNYGGAWQDQAEEFDAFPGAILMTTNCIQRPRDTYKARIFTSGLVAWPGVRHIANHDFSPVIAAAQAAPGFAQDGSAKTILVGFGHQSVLAVAGKVIDAVKSGALKRFFLIGGCDGARTGRNYFTELAEAVPKDCAILTLACGKFRFNKLEFGDIGGIPRLLDIGQCNDAYSAVQIAVALANAFGTDVNGLPLSLVISWYEQKAVAVLLTLLSLGIKNIRLGPTLPMFVTPSTLGVLVEKFGIKPIGSVTEDLKAMLA